MGAPAKYIGEDRDIEVTDKRQKEAIRAMIEKPGISAQELAEICDVSERTIYRWKRDPVFVKTLISATRNALMSNLPALYQVAVSNALKGQLGWMRLVFEHIHHMESINAQLEAETHWTIKWAGDLVVQPQSAVNIELKDILE